MRTFLDLSRISGAAVPAFPAGAFVFLSVRPGAAPRLPASVFSFSFSFFFAIFDIFKSVMGTSETGDAADPGRVPGMSGGPAGMTGEKGPAGRPKTAREGRRIESMPERHT
jgi:hypothetical protein